jgi:amino acid adenylation domain-containing protein
MSKPAEITEAKVAPLSYEQMQSWLLRELTEDPAFGNESRTVIMRGPLDACWLHDSLRAFIGRHAIWRSVIANRDGQLVQVVTENDRCEWSDRDLTRLAGGDAEKRVAELAAEELQRPIDPYRGPLVRAMLARLAPQDHRLILTLPRMIFDDVALAQVFLPELRELYEARAAGRAEPLGEVPAHYLDYARRQQDGHDEAFAAHLSFWQEYLAGAPTILELPADHPRSESADYPGGVTEFALGRGVGADLRRLSEQEQVALPVTLMAGFAALLHRYTGHDELLVGLDVSRRERSEWHGTMGPFDKVVAMRADLRGEPSARELLQRTQAAMHATRPHHRAPLEGVVRVVNPERRPGCHPLVQVLISTEQGRPGPAIAGWELATAELPPRRARFDLCLELDDQSPDLTGRILYRSDLFEPETISGLIGRWRLLLAGMAAEPSHPVARLSLLTEAETRQLLRPWQAATGSTAGESVEQMIGRQASSDPDATAVLCGAARLSYQELDSQANQLARHLMDLGAGPETPVGVSLERSADQVVALLGILRAGATYVPMDPDLPVDRIRYVLHDSQMQLVVSEQSMAATFEEMTTGLVLLDRDRELIGQQSGDELAARAKADQLAYITYTSGSTGRPKGVMIERGALAAHCATMITEYGLDRDDVVLQFSQYSFDQSLEQILPTLAAGARLVMRGPEVWSSAELLDELLAHGVTVMNLPPAYWHQVVRAWAQMPADLAALKLRLAIVGGDRLELAWLREWAELGLNSVRLLNAYGPTETTITATLADTGADADRVTIGRPVGSRPMCVLDGRGQLLPAGMIGELHIGGPMVARGYLNQPELTAQRFVADPFGGQDGSRLYKTGDLVRQLPDGHFEYIGRQDQQVKMRGYRIELGEIESALVEHPGVEDAVVVTQDDDGERVLVGYVVAGPAGLADDELRSHLTARLPRYMQPAVIQQLAQLPRLTTGKPDRRALPRVDLTERRSGRYVAPRLLIEEQLVQIWADLLAVSPIGIRDNFFDLGGHSLLAAQLAARIEQLCGQRVRLSTLFAEPTIEQLAEVLSSSEPVPQASARVLPVRAAGSRRPFFFLHGDWTGGAFYCFALAQACTAEQPFYVLEPYTFSDRSGAPTFEAVASAHIEAMRAVQPAGPYRIGGFCNGGLLAYEMACQLRASGEQVEFLGLVNPSEPAQSSALRAACQAVNKMLRVDPSRRADNYLRTRHALRHLYRVVRPAGRRVEDFGKLLAIEPRLRRMFPPRDALYRDYVGVFDWLVTDYRPGIYDEKITFYWAREEPAISRSWLPVRQLKKPAACEEHTIDGALMSSVTEHVDSLAAVLSECLDRAEREAVTR